MKERGVLDLMSTKLAALRLAVDAATTILKIDQIIMSKPAGGPKPQ
jgi:T-complex protein 1 subunit theta